MKFPANIFWWIWRAVKANSIIKRQMIILSSVKICIYSLFLRNFKGIFYSPHSIFLHVRPFDSILNLLQHSLPLQRLNLHEADCLAWYKQRVFGINWYCALCHSSWLILRFLMSCKNSKKFFFNKNPKKVTNVTKLLHYKVQLRQDLITIKILIN